MIEIFITNIQDSIQADKVKTSIRNHYSDLKINLDLNETGFLFPCGHTILRVEGDKINSDEIIVIVNQLGFKCEILEDKICA